MPFLFHNQEVTSKNVLDILLSLPENGERSRRALIDELKKEENKSHLKEIVNEWNIAGIFHYLLRKDMGTSEQNKKDMESLINALKEANHFSVITKGIQGIRIYLTPETEKMLIAHPDVIAAGIGKKKLACSPFDSKQDLVPILLEVLLTKKTGPQSSLAEEVGEYLERGAAGGVLLMLPLAVVPVIAGAILGGIPGMFFGGPEGMFYGTCIGGVITFIPFLLLGAAVGAVLSPALHIYDRVTDNQPAASVSHPVLDRIPHPVLNEISKEQLENFLRRRIEQPHTQNILRPYLPRKNEYLNATLEYYGDNIEFLRKVVNGKNNIGLLLMTHRGLFALSDTASITKIKNRISELEAKAKDEAEKTKGQEAGVPGVQTVVGIVVENRELKTAELVEPPIAAQYQSPADVPGVQTVVGIVVKDENLKNNIEIAIKKLSDQQYNFLGKGIRQQKVNVLRAACLLIENPSDNGCIEKFVDSLEKNPQYNFSFRPGNMSETQKLVRQVVEASPLAGQKIQERIQSLNITKKPVRSSSFWTRDGNKKEDEAIKALSSLVVPSAPVTAIPVVDEDAQLTAAV